MNPQEGREPQRSWRRRNRRAGGESPNLDHPGISGVRQSNAAILSGDLETEETQLLHILGDLRRHGGRLIILLGVVFLSGTRVSLVTVWSKH